MSKWKKEHVVDHKFDYLDVDTFRKFTFWNLVKFTMMYAKIMHDLLIFTADIASMLLLFYGSIGLIQPAIPISVTKWIYLFCVVSRLLLLIVDAQKTRRILRGGDISLAYTTTLAYRYYSLQDYSYFCLFQNIDNLQKSKDRLALYVYFRLKGWLRLLLAEAPRQIINVMTLISFYSINGSFPTFSNGNFLTNCAIVLISFSVLNFMFSLAHIAVAVLMYVCLISSIRGNLKEYCCHKIDKRYGKSVWFEKLTTLELAN